MEHPDSDGDENKKRAGIISEGHQTLSFGDGALFFRTEAFGQNGSHGKTGSKAHRDHEGGGTRKIKQRTHDWLQEHSEHLHHPDFKQDLRNDKERQKGGHQYGRP